MIIIIIIVQYDIYDWSKQVLFFPSDKVKLKVIQTHQIFEVFATRRRLRGFKFLRGYPLGVL